MFDIINLNHIFLKYKNLVQKDFLLSSVWIEYHLSDELDLLRKNGATEEWINTNIFEYEERYNGSGTIFYAIPGEDFYKNGEFVNIKSIMVVNSHYHFIGYQTIIKTTKREPKAFSFFINGKKKKLFYLVDIWKNENTRTLSSLSRFINQEIETIEIFTENKYKSIISPKVIFSLDNIYFS